MILTEALLEERPIPAHHLAAKSVGVRILQAQLGHSVSSMSRLV